MLLARHLPFPCAVYVPPPFPFLPRLPSPDEGRKTIVNAPRIGTISRQVSGKEPLLIEKTQNDECGHEYDCKKSPQGTKTQRNSCQHDQRPKVHGMAHDRIGPRSNHLLIACHFDSCRGERIDLKHPKDKCESEGDQKVARDYQGDRHPRPTEAMIQRGKEKHRCT